MDLLPLMSAGPYTQDKAEKSALYQTHLTDLTQIHGKNCPAYRRYLTTLGIAPGDTVTGDTVPMVPVSLFKHLHLKSVPDAQVVKTITSSGTTGQQVSHIYLDGTTASLQQRALYHIVSDFVGENRLPYLVLDSKKVLKDRAMFSARGAGILGFSLFASKTCYALDDEMNLDLEGVQAFLDQYGQGPVLLFGFTFMVWKHVVQALESQGISLSIPQGILIHGGGWKKLQSQAVSPAEFKARVKAALGVAQVSDYYGMAEQTGCVYMECPHGHLHASIWSDIRIRNSEDFSLCPVGQVGLIQVISLLPHSYPGHSILTEDMGVLLGEDDCPCGRKGKYFAITGRIPKAEVRGCSDTYEG